MSFYSSQETFCSLGKRITNEDIANQRINQLVRHAVRKVDTGHVHAVDDRIVATEEGNNAGEAIHRMNFLKDSGVGKGR
jgi:hypothetical protein